MKLFHLFLLFFSFSMSYGQFPWYSERETKNLLLQNSYPKGGPYLGHLAEMYKPSYLVFFSRIENKSDRPMEISLELSSKAHPIPKSPHTFVRLFLPPDTMTLEKQPLFSYGITELKSLPDSTSLLRRIPPKGACLFYVFSLFYQTESDHWLEKRGGNRAELVVKGNELFYKLLPQVNELPIGRFKYLE